MNITVRKTDKRFTGSDILHYVVDIKHGSFPVIYNKFSTGQQLKKFQDVRNWCIETWGMSCEREHYLHLLADDVEVNTHWCWHSEFYDIKIYLRTDKEANWFKLKWL